MAEPRSGGFGSVVVAGLATAALSSVASGKSWYTASVDYKLAPGVPDPDKAADMPLALALSLVVLAGWGALLVSRGRVRRLVAGVALVASVGVVGCVVAAPFTLPDQVRGRLPAGSGHVEVSPTAWFVVAAVAAVLCVAVLVVAFRRAPSWPTMSSRYDAPGAGPATLRTDTDLWKALDEGRDPTDPIEGHRPSSP
jgi:uncharacterized membrane protein (TIGR02234 family)